MVNAEKEVERVDETRLAGRRSADGLSLTLAILTCTFEEPAETSRSFSVASLWAAESAE